MDDDKVGDFVTGLEMSLMTQEQVVSEFRELAARDLGLAALKYDEFAQKLELVAFDGNAQVRSLAGGPDSASRAGLMDILVGNYVTASNDVREQVLGYAVLPMLPDNSFYVQLSLVKVKNPFLVADIIRKYGLYNPGADFYEADLLKDDNLASPGNIQAWIDKLGGENYFAAMAIALQREYAADVGIVIDANRALFEGAAHIVASHHDTHADRKIANDPFLDKTELLERYRSRFVDEFAEMVRQKTVEARWLPTTLTS